MSEHTHLSPAAPRMGRQTVLLLAALLPAILVTIRHVPVSYPEGDFILNVLSVIKTGHVSATFTPDTYPYLVGTAYRLKGFLGFLVLQSILYILLAACVLWLMRRLATSARAWLLPAAWCVCLDPDLLSSLPKVWDTELVCMLLLAFTALAVATLVFPSVWRLAGLATVWGFGISVRPNFALLILPVLYALWLAQPVLAPSTLLRSGPERPGQVRFRSWLLQAAAVLLGACVVLLLANRLSHGAFYLPQNGPYNFFAGANAYTIPALLHRFNAEDSVPPALAALGIYPGPQHDATYSLALRGVYTHQALVFLTSHPLRWLGLCCVKLMTLLRADTKTHPLLTAGWLLKIITAMCVPGWLAVLAWGRRLEAVDRLILLTVASYILPFLLTNADPRFRTPLDVLVLTHAVGLLLRGRAQAADARAPTSEGADVPAAPVFSRRGPLHT